MKNINVKELLEAMDELEKEKGIKSDYLIEALENALVTAYKKNFESAENVKKTKANLFAENTLIEKNAYCNFVNAQNFSLSAIKAFAKTQNILPAIVIGRLQNDSFLKWSDFFGEIVKYEKM